MKKQKQQLNVNLTTDNKNPNGEFSFVPAIESYAPSHKPQITTKSNKDLFKHKKGEE